MPGLSPLPNTGSGSRNAYKEAVVNQAQKPSAVVAATDPTSVPNLERSVGAQTGMEPSVAQAQDALKSSASGN